MKVRHVALASTLIVATVAAAYLGWPQRADWTIGSPEAAKEFEAGLEARGKLYSDEAHRHFARALELDRTSPAALIFAAEYVKGEADGKAGSIVDRLRALDTSRLTEREKFLRRYEIARLTRDVEGVTRVIKEFVTSLPDDPFALDLQGRVAVSRMDWQEAESLFQHLTKVAPNWVEAYNQLGYLAMAQGKFADSERMFKTYMFVADKQANPHDSLGELLVLTGRYAEARQEFEKALAIKEDFCASYRNLLSVAEISGELDGVDEILARASRVAACRSGFGPELTCFAKAIRFLHARDWEAIWSLADGECARTGVAQSLLRFNAGLATGRFKETAQMEAEVRKEAQRAVPASARFAQLSASAASMEGGQLLVAGKAEAAVERFLAADRLLFYRGFDEGVFKLFNRSALVAALAAAGRDEAARAMVAEIDAVNPRFLPVMKPIFSFPGEKSGSR